MTRPAKAGMFVEPCPNKNDPSLAAFHAGRSGAASFEDVAPLELFLSLNIMSKNNFNQRQARCLSYAYG
jgi:hypothetical protein